MLVGNGAPNFIDGFVERTGLADKKVTIVTDPSLQVFRAAELERSFWSTMGPRAVRDAARAYRKGYRQTGIEGDKTQQGGVIVLDREGTINYHHVNRSLGDHAPLDEVVEAARRAAAA